MLLNDNSSWLKYLDAEELAKLRRKYWTFVYWPSDELVNDFDDFARAEFRRGLVRALEEAVVPALVSPIHDKDVNEDTGELAKPHVHTILFFEQPQRYKYVLKMLNYACGLDSVKYVQPVANIRSMMRYLVHLDNPEKVQYDTADVIEVSGAKYVLEDETASELVVEAILSNGFKRVSDVLAYFSANPSARKWTINNPGIVKTLCKEQSESKNYSKFLDDLEREQS